MSWVPVVADAEVASRFGELLTSFRLRRKFSANRLALGVCDTSYLTRVERGQRNPPQRGMVDALARALRLDELEYDQLLVAAGYAPSWVMAVDQDGALDQTVRAVAQVLQDPEMPDELRGEYRQVVAAISRRYH